jgi:hypothetical protein
MHDDHSITIIFDPVSWKPTLYLNGATDQETTRLQEIVALIIEAIKEQRP